MFVIGKIVEPGHGFRQISVDAFERAGVRPAVVFESAEIETVQALVAAGLGVSLVPRMVRRERGLAYVELTPPRPSRTLSRAWRRGGVLSPAARALKTLAIQRLQGPAR